MWWRIVISYSTRQARLRSLLGPHQGPSLPMPSHPHFRRSWRTLSTPRGRQHRRRLCPTCCMHAGAYLCLGFATHVRVVIWTNCFSISYAFSLSASCTRRNCRLYSCLTRRMWRHMILRLSGCRISKRFRRRWHRIRDRGIPKASRRT